MRAVIITFLLVGLYSFVCSQEISDWSGYIELYNEKGINSSASEFSPAYWDDQIVFISSDSKHRLQDDVTKEPFFDIYVSALNEIGSLNKAQPLAKALNSDYHEGPCDFSTDGKTIYFTRVDYQDGQLNQNNEKKVVLKLYEAEYINDNWVNTKKSKLNLENIASAHPTISYDNQYIIFASDRPEGYGKMDLYICTNKNGFYSNPINLGPEINSAGNDWFPYLNDAGYLFYASDGKNQGTDLDLYMSKIVGSIAGPATRLPEPLNTNFDDFGLVIDASGTNGFMSSNRPGGKGKDDIYSFNSLVSIFAFYDLDYNKLMLTVKDSETKAAMPEVLIRSKHLGNERIETFDQEIFLMEGENIDSIYSNEFGRATLSLKEGYTLLEAYSENKQKWQLVMSNHGPSKNLDVFLKDKSPTIKEEPKIVYIEKEVPTQPIINNVKVDVGAVIVFENIYYDYNSYNLTQGAKKELDNLAKLMLSNQRLKIQLSAHTDSRGELSYNQELSQKRAQSAKDYLVSRGIPSSNISAIGYGESRLRNHCKDGVYCSEAEHIYNRRTEVKILDN